MIYDFEIKPGVFFGDWFYAKLAQVVVIEKEGWAPERVTRVARRLQRHRRIAHRLLVVVPWLHRGTAYTLPGRYIYFARYLLERCPEDEQAAFIIAHELAHHDLGHVRLVPKWMPRFLQRHGGEVVGVAVRAVERRLYGPERECAADRHGIDLCRKAGYDVEKCLDIFRILEMTALDLGDRAIVYGPSVESDDELHPEAPALTKFRIWAWQRTRGYLPLRDRLQHIRHHLAGKLPPLRRTA